MQKDFVIKAKHAVKRVAAISAGATLMGATMMGAVAADLGDYPAPFVSDGELNGLVVVGSGADAADIVGPEAEVVILPEVVEEDEALVVCDKEGIMKVMSVSECNDWIPPNTANYDENDYDYDDRFESRNDDDEASIDTKIEELENRIQELDNNNTDYHKNREEIKALEKRISELEDSDDDKKPILNRVIEAVWKGLINWFN